MSATTPPRVSVIVPCYNLGRYVDEALDSLRQQTFTDFDLLIVDDGSDDEPTRARLTELSASGIRVLRTPNRGLSAARNTGIRNTTGELLCCVDADDVVAPTLLERSVEWLDRQPEIGFVSHWLDAFGDEQWDWRPTSCELPQLLENNTVNGASVMRRQLFETVGGFDESLRQGCEDWDFWISAIERGGRGAIIPEVLYRYRRRPDSMSRLMTGSDVFAGLYRRLAEKHAASFLAHLPSILAERERELAHFRNHVGALEAQEANWLTLTLQHARDTRDALQRALQRHEGPPDPQLVEEELAASRVMLEERDRDLAHARAVLVEREVRLREQANEIDRRAADARQMATRVAEAEAGRGTAEARAASAEAKLDGDLRRMESELRELRASWSWRLMAPLRALYEVIGRPGRRR